MKNGRWCLTTGQNWIFGVIEGRIKDQAARKSFTLKQLDVDFSSPATIHDQLETVFLVMLFWVCIQYSMSIRESELTFVCQSS